MKMLHLPASHEKAAGILTFTLLLQPDVWMNTVKRMPINNRLLALCMGCCLLLASVVSGQNDYKLINNRVGPLTDVDWQGDTPLVEFDGQWWEFVSLNGIDAATLVQLTKESDGNAWRDQFGLSFPHVLLGRGIADLRNVDLVLKIRETGTNERKAGVVMTEENWFTLAFNRFVVRQRVQREHSTEIPRELAYIAKKTLGPGIADGKPTSTSVLRPAVGAQRFANYYKADIPKWSVSLPNYLSREEAEQDLDQLEWLLNERYSYANRRDIPYKAALDVIRAKLPEQVTRNDFGLQIQRVLGLFGDMHCRVRENGSLLNWNDQGQRLPFIVKLHNERVVAIRPDRSGFLHQETPYIKSIHDIPIARWRDAALRGCGSWR